MRLRPPNRSNRSASSSFLICAVRVGCDTYNTVAGCVKLVSFRHRDEGAQLHCFSVRSKDSPGMPAYSACANERFVQETPESCNPPKLPIDTMTSVNHGACVLVETTPVLRWPAKSEATSPALLPAERKPVDGEPFDSDPR
jgi:hypothetical protein